MSSNITLLPVQEPRAPGIARTVSVTQAPLNGWCRSMTSPVKGSTPPQKLSPTSLRSNPPWVCPATRARPVNRSAKDFCVINSGSMLSGRISGRIILGADDFSILALIVFGTVDSAPRLTHTADLPNRG
jgi:hypothetical protein